MQIRRLIGFSVLLTEVLVASNRRQPQQPIILQSPDLRIVFDKTDGLPYKYQYKDAVIWGEDTGKKITAIICRLRPRSYITVPLTPVSAKVSEDAVDFGFKPAVDGGEAVSFHVRYSVAGGSVVTTLTQVEEHAGFELIEVGLPNLATIREEDGPGWLARGQGGGLLVQLNQAKAGRVPDDRFFGRIGTQLPVAMIGGDKVECVMEVSAFMDGTEVEITGSSGHHHALIGTDQVYRVHGGRSYDMNDGGPPVIGNSQTLNLPVGQIPRCRLDFVKGDDRSGRVDWTDGAKLLRARMPAIPTHYFDDKFLYLVHGKYKNEPAPRTTFAQSEALIHDVNMLTDSAPQVVFVSGWVYDGQDTGYPCEDKVNESMGGYDALMHLMRQGVKYAANVTLNVNYDDAYKSCAKWSESIIARRPDGQVWKSRDWGGETSYITGMAKYMNGPGVERVAYTIQRYGIHDVILVDALSWYAIRNDWDPEHPASGYKNLVDGRFKVIDEFLKYGVHVVSEMLRYPYVGKLAESADGIGGSEDMFGGDSIPLIPLVYRNAAIWGGASGPGHHPAANLFWDSRPIVWYSNNTDRADITDYYYLDVLPWTKMHGLNIESFSRTGDRQEIGLEQNSKIAVDLAHNNYSVVLHGVEIASDDATFCPLDENRIALYSAVAKPLKMPLPAGWDAKTVEAQALYADHRESYQFKVENGQIIVSVPARRPVMVYRYKAEH